MARNRKKRKRDDASLGSEKRPNTNLFGSVSYIHEIFVQLNHFSDTIRGRRIVCFFVGLFTFFLGLWTFDSKLSLSGDNAEFITLARSLVEGQGLQYLNLPDPVPA